VVTVFWPHLLNGEHWQTDRLLSTNNVLHKSVAECRPRSSRCSTRLGVSVSGHLRTTSSCVPRLSWVFRD